MVTTETQTIDNANPKDVWAARYREANTDKPLTANQAAAQLFSEAAKFGNAFDERGRDINLMPALELVDLNPLFWMQTLKTGPHPIVLLNGEYLQYGDGVYSPTTEALVVLQLLFNLQSLIPLLPPRVIRESFNQFLSKARMKAILENCNSMLIVDENFFRDKSGLIAVKNGTLAAHFQPHTSNVPLRETLPVIYDEKAKCEQFIKFFLSTVLCEEDIDLVQRYSSQILTGQNYSQTILLLTGESNSGKSTFMKVLSGILGWNKIGIIREQLYKNDLELAHYAGKHLLHCPDMSPEFLNRKEAGIFKQLVGGDPLWAETKNGGRQVIEGRFPIILSCSGKPKLHLNADTDAWGRRLAVVEFHKPKHGHIGKLGEVLLNHEASGILNWLIGGQKKLLKDGLQLVRSQAQKERVNQMLLSSDSPKAFAQSCLIKKEGEELSLVSPVTSKPATRGRFKTSHSEVRDSYHFRFFNQVVSAAS